MEKIVLITGANKGIGLQIAKELVELGCKVIVTARDAEKGSKAVSSIGSNVTFCAMDVTNQDSITKAANFVQEKFGKLDVLINNAGIGVGNTGLVNVDIDEIKNIMETNFYGPMRVSSTFIPLLQKSKDARIINVSSRMGQLQSLATSHAGYRLSKAGLNVQTLLLHNELEGQGIKVNSVCPGWVKTDMGGSTAPGTVKDGADTIVWLTIADKIPSGKFFAERKEISW